MSSKRLGEEGFRWWIGVIEDIMDPAKAGRVRVRINNIHGDKASTPPEALQWSHCSMPLTNPALSGIGRSPTGIDVGCVVWGFFMDGPESQRVFVVGTWHGVDDVSGLAKGQQTLTKDPLGPEPESAFHAQYPFNHVWTSKSGHVVEIDDTPNFERMHWYHRTGTYQEIDHEGRRVNKIVGDDFEIVQKGKTVYIQGNLNVQVLGNATISVGGSANVSSQTGINVSAPAISLLGAGSVSITAPLVSINGSKIDKDGGYIIPQAVTIVKGLTVNQNIHADGNINASGTVTGTNIP